MGRHCTRSVPVSYAARDARGRAFGTILEQSLNGERKVGHLGGRCEGGLDSWADTTEPHRRFGAADEQAREERMVHRNLKGWKSGGGDKRAPALAIDVQRA
eukprot:scaffold97649_cov29-Tisochrysis_lutea.AAC.3